MRIQIRFLPTCTDKSVLPHCLVDLLLGFVGLWLCRGESKLPPHPVLFLVLPSVSYAESRSLAYRGKSLKQDLVGMGSSCWRPNILQLLSTCIVEQRGGPSRAFCGSRLRDSRWDRLMLVISLILDKVKFVWLKCRLSVLGCGPIKVRMIHVGTARMHAELPEQRQLSRLYLQSSSATASIRDCWIFFREIFKWLATQNVISRHLKTCLGCSVDQGWVKVTE